MNWITNFAPHDLATLLCGIMCIAFSAEGIRNRKRDVKDGYSSANLVLSAIFTFFMGVAFQAADYPLVVRTPGPFTSGGKLFQMALPVAIIATIALMWQQKREKNPLFFLYFVAVFPFIYVIQGHLQLFNGVFDRSTQKSYRVRILGTHDIPAAGKSGRKWRIVVADWKEEVPQISFASNQQQAQWANRGGIMEARTRAGALGVEWIQTWRFVK